MIRRGFRKSLILFFEPPDLRSGLVDVRFELVLRKLSFQGTVRVTGGGVRGCILGTVICHGESLVLLLLQVLLDRPTDIVAQVT